MSYKDYLSIIRKDNLCTFKEPLMVEKTIKGGSQFFTSLYRSPSQN